MVTISDCRGCREQFPAEDLSSDELCVACFDKAPGHWNKPGPIPMSAEEKKRRKKARKKLYYANNREEILAYERQRRAKLERRE